MSIPFIQAKHYRRDGNLPIRRLTIHTAECSEATGAARAVARYFQTVSRPASAHACIDNKEIVQCVLDKDVAYHAPPNPGSLGGEMCGTAAQTAAQWADDYSQKCMALTAMWAADKMRTYGVDNVFVGPALLVQGRHGWCRHVDVSNTWHQTSHTDPGPNFPVDQFTQYVNFFLAPSPDPHPEVFPLFNPPVPVVDIMAWPHGGSIGLGPNGEIYNEGGSPYFGGGNTLKGFVGPAAQIEYRPDTDPSGYPEGYSIINTAGQVYRFPDPTRKVPRNPLSVKRRK